MTILQLLASDSFITFNKQIAKKYGLEEAVLLGALCSYQSAFGGEFYKEQETILEDTALTLYSLRKAMKTLQDNEILIISKKGIPAKNYYRINDTKLFELLMSRPIEIDRSGGIEIDSTINNNKYNNNKKEIYKEKRQSISQEKLLEYFNTFFAYYPRRVSREQAKKTFEHKLYMLEENEAHDIAVKMYNLLKRQIVIWQKENDGEGRKLEHIPYCSTWLNDNVPDSKYYKRGKK